MEIYPNKATRKVWILRFQDFLGFFCGFSHLLEVAHHLFLVTPENAAEELHDLLVIQVVDTFDDPGQEQLYRQVKISVELI